MKFMPRFKKSSAEAFRASSPSARRMFPMDGTQVHERHNGDSGWEYKRKLWLLIVNIL